MNKAELIDAIAANAELSKADAGRALDATVAAISKADTAVMIIPFLVTVFHRIEYGVYVGTILAALVFLGRAGRVHLHELLPAGQGRYDECAYDGTTPHLPSALVAISIARPYLLPRYVVASAPGIALLWTVAALPPTGGSARTGSPRDGP